MNLYRNYQKNRRQQQTERKNEEIRRNDTEFLNGEADGGIVIVYEKSSATMAAIKILKVLGQTAGFLTAGFGIATLTGYLMSLF